jgi:hypothetical protein
MSIVDSTTIHDPPATIHAASAVLGCRARANSTSAIAVPIVPTTTSLSGPHARLSGGNRATPVTEPALTGGDVESGGSNQRPPEVQIGAAMAQADPHGTPESLRRPPPEERRDGAERIEPKGRRHVPRGGGLQMLREHQLSDDRLPCRRAERRGGAEENVKASKVGGVTHPAHTNMPRLAASTTLIA